MLGFFPNVPKLLSINKQVSAIKFEEVLYLDPFLFWDRLQSDLAEMPAALFIHWLVYCAFAPTTWNTNCCCCQLHMLLPSYLYLIIHLVSSQHLNILKHNDSKSPDNQSCCCPKTVFVHLNVCSLLVRCTIQGIYILLKATLLSYHCAYVGNKECLKVP